MTEGMGETERREIRNTISANMQPFCFIESNFLLSETSNEHLNFTNGHMHSTSFSVYLISFEHFLYEVENYGFTSN